MSKWGILSRCQTATLAQSHVFKHRTLQLDPKCLKLQIWRNRSERTHLHHHVKRSCLHKQKQRVLIFSDTTICRHCIALNGINKPRRTLACGSLTLEWPLSHACPFIALFQRCAPWTWLFLILRTTRCLYCFNVLLKFWCGPTSAWLQPWLIAMILAAHTTVWNLGICALICTVYLEAAAAVWRQQPQLCCIQEIL